MKCKLQLNKFDDYYNYSYSLIHYCRFCDIQIRSFKCHNSSIQSAEDHFLRGLCCVRAI